MSAIFGLLSLDGREVRREELVAMGEGFASWGPDGAGYWQDGPVGMGQRTLCTTLESGEERFPLTRREAAVVLVADARIDNREELNATLGLAGSPSRVGDGALILAAYDRWGEDCAQKLLGDFAFAVWDARAQRLFCARDPMGTRPFYYFISEGRFAFGSQIKALLCIEDVPRRLNEAKLAEFLALLPPDKDTTFYEEIRRLPPAHTLSVSDGERRLRRYWRLNTSRELRLGSDQEYAAAFAEVFGEAVRCRLRSRGPIGAMLSGGLDSSSIVATASRLTQPGQELHTFSGTFPSLREVSDKVDETRYIEQVVAGTGVDAHYVAADAVSPLFDFLWRGEEPIPAAAMYMDWTVLQAMSERGVRVLLSGNDGDSVVGYGTAYLAELAWKGKWRSLLDELYALSRKLGVGRRTLLQQFVFPTFVPGPFYRAWRRLREDGAPEYDPRSVIRPEFAERVGLYDHIRQLRDERPERSERKGHWHSLDSSLLTLLLEIFARGCAHFSIEPRYPFFDRRLVEFCLSLPGDQKLHNGWNRVVMRRAMEGMLPAEVQWRASKQDLGRNFNVRLLEHERELLDEIVLGPSGGLDEYFDSAALRTAYERYLAKPPTRTRDSFTVFWAVILALWLRESGLAT